MISNTDDNQTDKPFQEMTWKEKFSSLANFLVNYENELFWYNNSVSEAMNNNLTQQKQIEALLSSKKVNEKRLQGSYFCDEKGTVPHLSELNEKLATISKPKKVKWKASDEQKLMKFVSEYQTRTIVQRFTRNQLRLKERMNEDEVTDTTNNTTNKQTENNANTENNTHLMEEIKADEFTNDQDKEMYIQKVKELREKCNKSETEKEKEAETMLKQLYLSLQNKDEIELQTFQFQEIANLLKKHSAIDCHIHYNYLKSTKPWNDQDLKAIQELNDKPIEDLSNKLEEIADDEGRPFYDVCCKYQEMYSTTTNKGEFTEEEDRRLNELIKCYGCKDWLFISSKFNDRSPQQCLHRYEKSLVERKKGKWSEEESKKAVLYNKLFPGQWSKICKYIQGRTDAQIRDHLMNSNCLGIAKRRKWTEEEDRKLLHFCSTDLYRNEKTGKIRWSKLCNEFENRSDNQLVCRYKCLMKKKDKKKTKPSDTPVLLFGGFRTKNNSHK